MPLYLYVAYPGRRLAVDVNNIASPDALKQWIAENTEIPIARQILMTSKGKNVKQQHLVSDSEIFVYDKNLLSTQNDDKSFQPPAEIDLPSVRDPPSVLENENSLTAWQELFKSRREWADQATDVISRLTDQIAEQVESCEIIERAASVALDNLRNHVALLQTTFDKTRKWASDLLAEQAEILNEWRDTGKVLAELPIREDIGQLLSGSRDNGDHSGTMYGLLDITALEDATGRLQKSSVTFRAEVDTLEKKMGQLDTNSTNATQLIRFEWPNLNAQDMLQEAEALAKKIGDDCEDVLHASLDTKSISRVSRQAAVHTNDLLPGLQDLVAESGQMLRDANRHHHALSEACAKALQQVSMIQSSLGGLQSQISALSIGNEAQSDLDSIERVFRLPLAYGSILVEAIRRSEWNNRMISDLKDTKEDVMQQKNEELRRRKKWLSGMVGFLDTGDATTSVVDFSFSTPANPWPFVSREEVFSYIDDLRALGIDDAVEQVAQLLKSLDSVAKPSKQRPNTFKNGSVHDLRNSSYFAGTDEVRALQDDKIRLEDRLRASDSRVRKLEDLLHRQSQFNRAGSGAFTPTTDFERPPTSPIPAQGRPTEQSSRRSSVSARRMSNQTPDEKAATQRIVTLEAQILKLQQEAHAERRSSTENRDKMNEAESVKRDLMANFEAQRQEFEDERQRLEDDNHDLKVKMEELEEELDRVTGSRDHERMKQDSAISHFRSELERLRRSANEEVEQSRLAKEQLEHDLATQVEKTASAEKHEQQQRDEKSSLQTQTVTLAENLRDLKAQQQDFVSSLQSAHAHLSPAGSAPDDLKRLVNTLEVLCEGAAIHARGQDDAVQFANAEIKANEDRIADLEAQLANTNVRLETALAKATSLADELRQGQHALSLAKSDLNDGKAELQQLRAKFAAGETGSDTLRTQLAAAERKLVELTEAKNASDAQIRSLEHDVEKAQSELQNLEERRKGWEAHFASREKKCKELSEKLFQQNDRMVRMLENFGYSVARQGEGLLIQRASKVNASAILEAGTAMKRTVSGSAPVQHYSDPADLETLYWQTQHDGAAEDAKYQAFVASLSRLDLDATVEMITKRYKDVETLAKKYQKDSRSNRDKNNRLQSEAHDKIAYRSFKEGDLALFLPTRNQATRPWAAFNVGAPHYFLREQDAHKLQSRDWLLARIGKIEERVVDLSKSLNSGTRSTSAEAGDGSSLKSLDDENPFELSDGLRWYLIDASEEKPGAPSTPGLGSSTIATSKVDVKGHMGRKPIGGKDSATAGNGAVNAAKTLHKSLDSRRSSEASRKSSGMPQLRPSGANTTAPAPLTAAGTDGETEGDTASPAVVKPSEADLQSKGPAREDARVFDVKKQPAMLKTTSSRESRLNASTDHASPSKSGLGIQHAASPAKAKGQGWDKLFSFQYHG